MVLLKRFVDMIAAHGCPETAMMPGYGLAEATLVVSVTPVGAGMRQMTVARKKAGWGDRIVEYDPAKENLSPEERMIVTSIGTPLSIWDIRMTDADGKPVEDGVVGVLEIRSESTASGYWRNERLTKGLYAEDGWLITGDLAYMKDGWIYIVGRVKDLIILNGANYFPHDLERILSTSLGIVPEKVVAAAVPVTDEKGETREGLGVFIEHAEDDEFRSWVGLAKEALVKGAGIFPDAVVAVDAIPRTVSHKPRRFMLAESFAAGDYRDQLLRTDRAERERNAESPLAQALLGKSDPKRAEAHRVAPERVAAVRSALMAELSRMSSAPIDPDRGLMEQGITSKRIIALQARLTELLGFKPSAAFFFDYPTINDLAAGLAEAFEKRSAGSIGAEENGTGGETRASAEDRRIAVVGMSCRFPSAASPHEFWDLILSGASVFKPMPDGRREGAPVDPEGRPGTLSTDRGAWLKGLDAFDPEVFGINAMEARSLSLEERLLLVCAWEAFENAGISRESLRGSRTGVWTGLTSTESFEHYYRESPENYDVYSLTGMLPSGASGRLSHFFDLKGPSVVLDTACSSSLAALSDAVEALRSGRADLGLVSAVGVITGERGSIALSRMRVLSASGACRPYAESADGYIRGEGCGALVLKRLADAEKDGDRILAVIDGTAVGHDGRASSLTAPNGRSQSQVIEAALQDARVSADDIELVEGHGTGTPLGDPIEVEALERVYGARGPRTGSARVRLGSVKSQLGHLEAAAGMASLIKVILALNENTYPPMHLEGAPTGRVDWERSSLMLSLSAEPWDRRKGRVRRAQVSGFGITGTNAAAVLSEAPAQKRLEKKGEEAGPQLVGLSARTPEAVRALAKRLSRTGLSGAEAARELNGRDPMAFRASAVISSAADLGADGAVTPQKAASRPPRIVFAFPGQGAEAPLGELGLWRLMTFPEFADRVERASARVGKKLSRPLEALLAEGNPRSTLESQIHAVVLGTALAAQYEAWGLKPEAMIGHSVGELSALAASGAMDFEAVLDFVVERAQAMDAVEGDHGGMLAVAASEAGAASLADRLGLGNSVAVAAVNGPRACVLSGTTRSIERLEAEARRQGLRVKRLSVPIAAHSPVLDSALPRIRAAAAAAMPKLAPQTPALLIRSTLDAQKLDGALLADPDRWVRQVRGTVRFADALKAMKSDLDEKERSLGRNDPAEVLFLEMGARRVLAPAGLSVLEAPWLGAMTGEARAPGLDEGKKGMLEALGALWCAGADVKLPLPEAALPEYTTHYPFDAESEAYPLRVRPVAATRQSQNFVKETKMAETQTYRRVMDLLNRITGKRFEGDAAGENWFALGLDSLAVVQVRQGLFRAFGTAPAIEEFYGEASTPEGLISVMTAAVGSGEAPAAAPMPVEAPAAAAAPAAPAAQPMAAMPVLQTPAAAGIAAGAAALQGAADLMSRQLATMQSVFAMQLAAMQPGAAVAAPAPEAQPQAAPAPLPAPQAAPAPAAVKPHPKKAAVEIKGLFKDFMKRSEFTPQQTAHAEKLAKVWNALSPTSKRIAELDRENLAGPRTMIGFKPEWKELVYPLIVDHAEGAYVWDADGRRYIDVTGGFGAALFGHGPKFITEALERELATGWPLGPQRERTGRVARKLCEITGQERAAFFTTGTESTMVATRLARAVTKKPLIAIFTGAFHGSFDGLLAAGWIEPDKKGFASVPITDGTTEGMVEDVIVLKYGEPDSLEVVKNNADRLAAVLVEPIQSRNPALQPEAFVKELRRITEENDIALIFDEMITGFRMAPGGMQEIWGVRADMTTYGKVLGGGMPIGCVAGKRRFLDAIDGGAWHYGDESLPGVHTAFVAGTFNQHALSMAAAEAVLDRIAEEGPGLARRLAAMTEDLCRRCDALFEKYGAPVRTSHYGSLFRLEFREKSEILDFHLLCDGIFVWEGRNCFLSAAHTEADVDAFVAAVEKGLKSMKDDGWFEPAQPEEGKKASAAGEVRGSDFFTR